MMLLPRILSVLYPRFIWRYRTDRKVVYLTFDDGPIPESTPWTLDLLKEKGVKATFFCVGDNLRKFPELHRRMVEEGHAVGNHTFNHLNGLKISTAEYMENVRKVAQYTDSHLFRPPYGVIRRSQAKLLAKEYRVIMWDVLSADYRQNLSPKQCFRRVMRNTRPGSVVVFHNHVKSERNMRYVLPRFIDAMREKGYEFELCW